MTLCLNPESIEPARTVGSVTFRATLRSKQSGLTLIELLISMTISLFMLIAISLVYISAKTGFAYSNNTVRMSEDASFALEMMGRDIRMAGYAGCRGNTELPAATPQPPDLFIPHLDLVDGQVLLAADRPNPFSGVIAGDLTPIFTSRNAVWGFAATNTTARNPITGGPTTYTESTTNPMLYVAGGSARALQVSGAVAPAANITIPADTYRWANNTNPTFMIIADCRNSEVFRASSVSLAAPFTIAHAATANDDANFANSYESNAVVTPLVTSVYFLATRVGAATPSLYRRFFNGSVAVTEELVPNVEAMTFHYGENTTNTPAGAPTFMADVYRTDPTTVNWSRVVSVRMGLILVSEDNNKAAVAGQTVQWLDGTYTPPAPTPTTPPDSRLRRAYSTTVSIRNRMGL